MVDFAELMLRTYELMRDNQALREHYQRRFRHILVDEFQDTNRLQYAWLKMFAGPPEHGCALFCVGDDDQSIYAFRGAQVGNMAAFEREYRVRTVVKLERNYRSYGNILDAANELISRNSRRLGKNLRTEAGPGEPVRVHEAPSDYAEAQWFIEEAQSLHREGTPRHEIALLYRSNAQSRVMESALFNAHIPYKVYGGLRFFERAEVKHALSYLRLIENPNDDTSFLRVVNFPARGIGARTIEQLQDAARASGRSLWQSVGSVAGKGGSNLARLRRHGRRDARRDARPDAARDHRPRARSVGPGRLLQDRPRRQGAAREPRGAGQRRRGVRDAGRLRQGRGRAAGRRDRGAQRHRARFAGAARATRASSPPPGAEVVTSGEIIAPPRIVPDAETGEIMSPLAAFLTHASLEAGDNQAQAGQDAIQLMTIHSAKGLEFDCVFISGLEEGLFPHENSSSDLDSLEEERRLMYVAITRARKRLYLSFSQTRMLHGQTRYNVKSRFLDELPESALRWITPRNQAFGSGFAREYQQAWQRGSGLHSIVGTGRSRAALRRADRAEGAVARPAPGAGRLPRQVRRRRRRHHRRRRRRCARPGQLRPPRHEVARPQRRQADAGRLASLADARCDSSARGFCVLGRAAGRRRHPAAPTHLAVDHREPRRSISSTPARHAAARATATGACATGRRHHPAAARCQAPVLVRLGVARQVVRACGRRPHSRSLRCRCGTAVLMR